MVIAIYTVTNIILRINLLSLLLIAQNYNQCDVTALR